MIFTLSLSTNFLAFSMQTLGSPAASSTISSIGLPATLLLMPIDLAAKTHSGREVSTNYFLVCDGLDSHKRPNQSIEKLFFPITTVETVVNLANLMGLFFKKEKHLLPKIL